MSTTYNHQNEPLSPSSSAPGNIRQDGESKTHRFHNELKWEFNLIDKLLYFTTPILLVIVWIVVRLFTSTSDIQISCIIPQGQKETTVHTTCLYDPTAQMYIVREGWNVTDSARLQENSTQLDMKALREGAPVQGDLDIYPIMACLCLIPLVMWRLIGRVDGMGAVLQRNKTLKNRSSLQGVVSSIWLVFCKTASMAVVVMLVYWSCSVHSEASGSDVINHPRFMNKQEPPRVFCDYTIVRYKSLGRNTAQCILYKEANRSAHLTTTLTAMVGSWLIGLLIATICNAFIVVVLFLLSLVSEKYRKHVMQRFLGERCPTDYTIDQSTTFMCVLAARNGQTLQVQHLLQQLSSPKHD